MNTLDDLRRSLDDRAVGASHGHGLVQAAQAGAVRIRRRRHMAGAAATACLVAAVAAVAPTVLARQRADHPPAVASPAPYRQPGQVTLGLVAGSKYFPISQGTDGNVQRLSLRNQDTTVKSDYGGEVIAFDPGTYDPAALKRGTKTTVSGHVAWVAPHYLISGRDPAQSVLGWQDPSGVWVVVFQLTRKPRGPEANLRAVAAAIRIGPARPLATPFQLATGPAGLPLTVVLALGGPHGFTDAQVAFGSGRPSVELPFQRVPVDPPLEVSATQQDNPDLTIRDGLTRIPPVAGHPAWYGDGTGKNGAPRRGGQLLVDAGTCTVQFISEDRRKVSRDDLVALAATTTYADCTDPSTWLPPLSR